MTKAVIAVLLQLGTVVMTIGLAIRSIPSAAPGWSWRASPRCSPRFSIVWGTGSTALSIPATDSHWEGCGPKEDVVKPLPAPGDAR